jgi:hypothetical protein
VRVSWLGQSSAIALLSIATGFLLVVVEPSVEVALIAATGLACVVPLLSRLVRHRLDLFEPIVIANVALLVMYVGRPSAIVAAKAPDVFKGYDVSGHIRHALVIALIGSVSLQIGYTLPWAKRTAARLPLVAGRWDVSMTVMFSIGLVVLAFGLFMIFLIQSGGFAVLGEMLKGRSFAQDSYFRNSSAYLYSAPALVWPASLLLLAMGLAEHRRGFVVAALLLMIPLGILAGSQGSRITLIPLLLSPGIYYYLARQRRPRPLAVAIVAYLVFTVGIAYFRETRTASVQVDRVHELKRSITDPSFEYSQLVFHGTDNDMFESLAAETIVVPSSLKASPLDYVYRTAAKPIPARLWKAKPLAPEELLTRTLYPGEKERASSSAGVVGSFYLMGLLPGVIVGMVLVGYAFRIPWEYWRRCADTSASQLLLTASLMFIPILLRGGVGDTLARLLYGVGPLVLAAHICGRRSTATEAAPSVFRPVHARS